MDAPVPLASVIPSAPHLAGGRISGDDPQSSRLRIVPVNRAALQPGMITIATGLDPTLIAFPGVSVAIVIGVTVPGEELTT